MCAVLVSLPGLGGALCQGAAAATTWLFLVV